MSAAENGRPEISIGNDVTEVVNNADATSCWTIGLTTTLALVVNALFFIWARRVTDINPYVIPLMGNVILFALYINITVIVTYHMKTNQANTRDFIDIGIKTFIPIIFLFTIVYSCCPCDDSFVGSSTYSSANPKTFD